MRDEKLRRFFGAPSFQRLRAGCTLQSGARYAFLIILACLTGAPLAWIAVTSTRSRNDVFRLTGVNSLDLSSYSRVWTGMNLGRHLLNSLIVCALTVCVVLVVATLAGYAFAKLTSPGLNIALYAFLAAMMIPGHALLIPMFSFLRTLGLLDSLTGLSFSLMGGGIAFSTFVLRAFFRVLPEEIGDAARLDGCSERGVFWRVYLPLARPGVAAVAIMQFVWTWNEFLFSATFITDATNRTLQPAIFQAVGQYAVDYPALSAGLVLGVIPVMAVYWSLQSQFLSGLGTASRMRGAIRL